MKRPIAPEPALSARIAVTKTNHRGVIIGRRKWGKERWIAMNAPRRIRLASITQPTTTRTRLIRRKVVRGVVR
jgi:hypothetical protein